MADTNPKISLVIPYYEVTGEKPKFLKRCLDSMRGMYDELILVFQPKGCGIGFVPAINKGYELATGDFIVMCCDDVYLTEGNLRKLCDKDHVTSAHVRGMNYQDFWGTLWCTPRWIYEKTGPICEEYAKGILYDDNEYYMMVKEFGPYTNLRVVVDHPHGGTTLELTPDKEAKKELNKKLFESRWHVPAFIPDDNMHKRYG